MTSETMRAKLLRARSLTATQQRRLVSACARLLVAQLRRRLLSGGDILRRLRGQRQTKERSALSTQERREVQDIAWALAVVANHLPWRTDCLTQALAASSWLRRRGLPADFYVGVVKREDGALTAHAWLRSDDLMVAGGEVAAFTTLVAPDV